MKKLLLLVTILGTFLVASSASALIINLENWGFNPNGTGYATALHPLDEIIFSGTSFIDNDGISVGSAFTELGTFAAYGFKNNHAPVGNDGNLNVDYELTAVLNASGQNTAITGDDVDFEFDAATLDFYLGSTVDYSTTAGFYGADNGIQIASFSLLTGGGNLDFSTLDGNTDITFEAISILAGYFFDQSGTDLSTYSPQDLIVGLTDSNNDIVAPDLTQISEWTEAGANIAGADPAVDIWTSTDGSFKLGVVPEPATMLLFGFGLLGLAGVSRRKKA